MGSLNLQNLETITSIGLCNSVAFDINWWNEYLYCSSLLWELTMLSVIRSDAEALRGILGGDHVEFACASPPSRLRTVEDTKIRCSGVMILDLYFNILCSVKHSSPSHDIRSDT